MFRLRQCVQVFKRSPMHSLQLALHKCEPQAAKDALAAIIELSREPEGKHAYIAERIYITSKRGAQEGDYFAVSISATDTWGRDPDEIEERDAVAAYRLGLSHAKFSKDVADTLTYAVRVIASHRPEEQAEIGAKLMEVVRSESHNLDSVPNSK